MAPTGSRCFFCRNGDGSSPGNECDGCSLKHHLAVREHLAGPQKVKFDDLLRLLRPGAATDEAVAECVRALQTRLKPAQIHPSGSVAKGTALRGEHDLDVVVVSGLTTKAIGQLLRACSSFKNIEVQKKIVKAVFTHRSYSSGELVTLPVDIIPANTLGGWGLQQIGHTAHYRKLSPWKKDVVRVLKAWARVRFPIPGILFEAVVDELDQPDREMVRNGFLGALRAIVSNPWLSYSDPLDRSNDFGDHPRVDACRHEFVQYCANTLDVCQELPIIIPGDGCMQSFPCQHEVSLKFGDFTLPPTCLPGTRIAQLYISLGYKVPEHFAEYIGFFQHSRNSHGEDVYKTAPEHFAEYIGVFQHSRNSHGEDVYKTATEKNGDNGFLVVLLFMFVLWCVSH